MMPFWLIIILIIVAITLPLLFGGSPFESGAGPSEWP